MSEQKISAFTKRIVDRFTDLETRGEQSLAEIVEDEFRKMTQKVDELAEDYVASQIHADIMEILNG